MWSMISIYTCDPRRLLKDSWGAQQAQGLCRGRSKSHLLSASLIPEPQEARDRQTGCVTKRVGSHLSRLRVPSAFSLEPNHTGKWGDKSNSLEQFGALCHSHSHGEETCSWRDPQSRGQQEWPRLHACQDPHMWDQARGCGGRGHGPACAVFPLETSPASAPHPSS